MRRAVQFAVLILALATVEPVVLFAADGHWWSLLVWFGGFVLCEGLTIQRGVRPPAGVDEVERSGA